MKKTRTAIIVGIVLGLTILLTAQSSLAWSITPAKWTLYHKNDFEIKTYQFPIEIVNDVDTPITVALTIKKAEYMYDGNTQFPNLEWISIDKPNLEVPGNSKARAMITINIKNQTSAYSQSWEFWIHAAQTAGAGNIRTNYNCRWTLQTPTRYIPLEERPGYIAWDTIIMIFGILGGIVIVIFFLFKKGIFSKKPKPVLAEVEAKLEMPEPKRERKKIGMTQKKPVPKKNANVIKYKKGY
jgi:hypothetical protein